MNRILLLFISAVFLYVLPGAGYAADYIFSAGIQAGAGAIGEVLPRESEMEKSRTGGYALETSICGDVKIMTSPHFFHEVYVSCGLTKGRYAFEDETAVLKNNYTSETYTAMYRIGGVSRTPGSRERTMLPVFVSAGAGLALDRYRSGPFSDETNSMIAGKPYLLRPVFSLGCGLLYDHFTFNVAELRLDTRFQRQPQRSFQNYLTSDVHFGSNWIGAAQLYTGVSINF